MPLKSNKITIFSKIFKKSIGLILLCISSYSFAQNINLECNLVKVDSESEKSNEVVIVNISKENGIISISSSGSDDFSFSASNYSGMRNGYAIEGVDLSDNNEFYIFSKSMNSKSRLQTSVKINRNSGALEANYSILSRRKKIGYSFSYTGVCKKIAKGNAF